MNVANFKNQLTVIVAVLLISIAVVIAAVVISNTNFYIKNLGTSIEQNGKLVNTLTVSGDGQVFAKPDMAEIGFSISEVAGTSQDALKNANTKIDQITNIIKSKGVDPKDIQTSQFNVSPEYDYTSTTRILKGKRATIGLDVKVKKIDDKATKATQIIDEVAKVDNVQISNITFDIEDKTSIYSQARSDAMAKAKQKANELAGLASVKLLAPV